MKRGGDIKRRRRKKRSFDEEGGAKERTAGGGGEPKLEDRYPYLHKASGMLDVVVEYFA